MRVGIGYDVHAFEEERPLILGGVHIPGHAGLAGHSDADVLLHAVMDSLLGALALGDIGAHFPDTDDRYAGADSLQLLDAVWQMIDDAGYRLGNLDAVIVAQAPKMAPYIEAMRENIAKALRADVSQVSVKATTEEHLGFTGREEGIAAKAAALLIIQ
ncbi:2-C-methyl-D-erythritol 2,4-cyclodiphosphate synthase [Pseudoramibacter sp.]|uniref:2-C-methyl-D-erythritol 2,4-cyclodiphosphate synthase n=1 Tax=Pseudoramibacter sp. TaxID=2034862 RepID=UPI0025FD9CFC|nr:2-C-methyl-D-erythritol 2,4-cyclodiphosphate synthase [Pseudoramibacter sp.]MCH4071703.1 2-C-methyl-D-erythritol 2,4-cyclodiphosphate synthase [Pseudoramibacter sp.]MCH4105471.1 2-C-methyl-D-erythritol 2,4-cyclodiphosphate synthase [Pseudoramibacter sp.]